MTQIHTGNQRPYSFSGQDAEGNSAPVDAVTAVSSNPDLVSVRQGGSAQEIIVADVEGAGTGGAIVTFTIDVRIGEDVSNVTVDEAIEIVAGDAVTVNAVAGAEEPRSAGAGAPPTEPPA